MFGECFPAVLHPDLIKEAVEEIMDEEAACMAVGFVHRLSSALRNEYFQLLGNPVSSYDAEGETCCITFFRRQKQANQLVRCTMHMHILDHRESEGKTSEGEGRETSDSVLCQWGVAGEMFRSSGAAIE